MSASLQPNESSEVGMKLGNVLLCCTGSVATIKTATIATQLQQKGCQVKIVVTEKALHFLKNDIQNPQLDIIRDEDEWSCWKERGDPVLHIELRRWADLVVIAPLDANTMGKIANGLCDNLLTCVLRAWDMEKPRYFAPAMNTYMWNHPFTAKHRKCLVEELGFIEIPSIEKKLVCGDVGLGAMAAVNDIVDIVVNKLTV